MRSRLRELTLAIKYNHSPLDATEIRRLYVVEQWTLARIAERYGCHHSAIARRLAEMGIERRRGGNPAVDTCHCGKPAVKPGALCIFHRKLARARASREFVRRRRRIPRARWRITYDLRLSNGMTPEQLRARKTELQREYRAGRRGNG